MTPRLDTIAESLADLPGLLQTVAARAVSGAGAPSGADVTIDDEQVRVRSPYRAGLVEGMRRVDGRRWDGQANTFPLAALPEVLRLLSAEGFPIDAGLWERAAGIEGEVKARAAAAAERVAASLSLSSDLEVPGLGGTLRPFQRAGVAYAIERRRVILGDEMGLGKTVEALATVEHEQAFPCVVVCPATLKANWQREAHRWLPHRSIEVLSGTRGEARLAWADIIILNYDIAHGWAEHLPEPAALLVDESQYCKTPGARRTRAVQAIAQRVPLHGLRLLLTGTAIVNRPAELLPQLRIMGRLGDFGGAEGFRHDFLRFDGYGWTGSRAETALHQRLRERCYCRRTKADALPDLPAKVWADVALDPGRLDLADYRRAEAELIRFLREQAEADARLAGMSRDDAAYEGQVAAARARAAEALVRLTTLRRLAGLAKVPEAIAWARDLIEAGQKVVVFGHHREALQTLAAALGAPLIIGGQSADERQRIVDGFQAGAYPALVCSIKAGGVGLTLTAASNVAFVEQDWTPAGMDQAADRCHRIGQTDSVTAWTLLIPDTIDEEMAGLLADKRQVVDAVLDGIEADSEGGSIVNDLLATYGSRA